jgi:hypothetical protein
MRYRWCRRNPDPARRRPARAGAIAGRRSALVPNEPLAIEDQASDQGGLAVTVAPHARKCSSFLLGATDCAATSFGLSVPETTIMLFLVVSTPRPEQPSELAIARQKFWPWIGKYQDNGICRHVYPRAGRGAVAVLEVESNEALHLILNEWADIIPAHFDTYPLVELEATKRMLAAQAASKS